MKLDLKGVSVGTWIRFFIMLIAIANMVLQAFGINAIPFTEEEIGTFVSIVFTAISMVVGFWKNNSFTGNAQEADAYLEEIKTIPVPDNEEIEPMEDYDGNDSVGGEL